MRYLDLNIPGIIRFWLRSVARNWYYRARFVAGNYGELAKTRKLRGSKSGKNAFVFGNGPSLKQLDVQKLVKLQKEQGFEVFAVNSYISSPLAEQLVPDYYILSDPLYFRTEKADEKLGERLRRDIKKLQEKGVTIFLPVEFFKSAVFKKQYAFYDAENIFRDNIDILGPRGYLSMTAYKALAVACFLGYSKIYICGFDNDYFLNLVVDESNDIYYIDKHFYDKPGSAPSKVRDRSSKNVGEMLYVHHYLFMHLYKFRKFPIVNLNKQGIVDAFPKHHDLDVYL